MSKRIAKKVKTSDGRWLGYRHVMYCREQKKYVRQDGSGLTDSRFDAWTGTPTQSRAAREVFGIPDSFVTYEDGKEKGIV